MALAGGAADKLGNGYERRFTVLAMIDILMGRADSLRVEVPGDAGAGAEFCLQIGTTSTWTQSKRQRSVGSWTIKALLREGFLQDWQAKLQAGDRCVFSSTTSADELRQLCDGARDAINLNEFEAEFLKSGRDRKFELLKKAWGGSSSSDGYQMLRLIKVDTIDDDRLDQQIETSLHLLVAGNTKAARRVLLQYADEIIHREISGNNIWDFLQDNGIDRAARIVTASATTTVSSDDRWLLERLDRLPPVTHGRIKAAIARDERAARRLVRLLADEKTPKDVIAGWAQRRPAWLAQSDWDTQIATAELAAAYGVPELHAMIFDELTREGCPPRSYWAARAVFSFGAIGNRNARDELLARSLSHSDVDHEYALATVALFDSRLDDARREIRAWVTDDPADGAAKALLAVQVALGHPDDDALEPAELQSALAISGEILSEDWLGGIAMWRARALIWRSRWRGSKILFGDLREAQEITLRVRDERRRYRGDSAAAVALSCEAAAMRGDLDFVLRTGLVIAQGGQATTAEAQSSEVAQHVALAALQRRQFDLAEKVSEYVTSPFHRKLIEALRAQEQHTDSSPYWREAIDLAADNQANLVQALNGLARTGATELPRLEDLQEAHPEAAAEVRATAEIHAGRFDGSIALLRTQRHQSITAAMTLAEAYRSIGELDSAAETLLDAADDFNDPHLRLQAAIILAGASEIARAKGIISSLIEVRDHDWPEFVEVLKFAAQLALDEANLELAATYCRQILHEHPADNPTRWILIRSLMTLDHMTDAWEVLCAAPTTLEPETRPSGQLWVELNRRFSDPTTMLKGCLDLLGKFRDDEEFNALVLSAVMMKAPTDDPVPAELLGRYHEALESFFSRWPESPLLRRIRTDNDDLLIKTLTDTLRPTPELLAERNRLNRQFHRGEKPLVLLAEYTGRTYCEILIRRATGVLPMIHPDSFESELCRQTVHNSADRDVAIDTSAIAVLAALPPDLRDEVVAVFRRGITTEEVARDTRHYGEDLRRSSGTLYYNADTDSPGLAELTEQETQAATESLSAIQKLISSFRRQPILTSLPTQRLRVNVQISVLQLSVSKRIAVWCDDAAARQMIRGVGIPTFSTFAALEYILSNRRITKFAYDAALDALLWERVGNPTLDLSRITRIARREAWQPGRVAACLIQPQAWYDIAETSAIANKLIATCHREEPDQVAAWLNAAVFGAVMSCTNTRSALEVGSLLLAGNLLQLPARGSLARDMVTAARAALQAALPADNPAGIPTDPLPVAARHMRTLLLKNPDVAAEQIFPVILECFESLDEHDLRAVTEAIVADDR